MVHELIQAFKREFWPKEEEQAEENVESLSKPEEKSSEDEHSTKCDYCGNNVTARAYHLHGKIICSPCLNNRFDDYTGKTFKRITNKTLDEVKKKI